VTAGPTDEARSATAASAPPGPPASPFLSVVVATREGWPAYRPMFEAHRTALDAVGGELIVVDGSGNPAPRADVLGPLTEWLEHPGESVLALRVHGYRTARGEIIAQSEDHVRVPPDWARAILRAHAEHPDAAAIGGTAENGSTRSAAEWAAFFVGHGRFAGPLGIGVPAVVLGLMNVSYKRWAITGIEPVDGLGVNEVAHQRALSRAGAQLLVDDRIRSTHIQAMTMGAASRLSFHAGRAMAATRRSHMTAAEWARVLVTPVSPPALTARLGLLLFRRRSYRRQFAAVAPAVLWLFACRATGELVGYGAGPGGSPKHLH
jgi:hypothetical protein